MKREFTDVLLRLNDAGYEAYLVGGVVRDMLLGVPCYDVDICTNARPQALIEVFADEVLDTGGVAFGSVRFKKADISYEITTFRRESGYHDGRHPEQIEFVDRLSEDLKRRDFTVNALCYHPDTGIVDEVGGLKDLETRTLRCIGDPYERFQEDVLRILRYYRFKAQLDFQGAMETEAAALELVHHLNSLPFIQLQRDLYKLLLADGFQKIALETPQVLGTIISELEQAQVWQQNNPYHQYNLYEHTIRTVQNLPKDWRLRLMGLFHDLGKLETETRDARGISRYEGHELASQRCAHPYLVALHCRKKDQEWIESLILHHDMKLKVLRPAVHQVMVNYGSLWAYDLFKFKWADNKAKSEKAKYQVIKAEGLLVLWDDILVQGDPLKTRDLALKTTDLNRLGIPKEHYQTVFKWLLDAVVALQVPNVHEDLYTYVKENWDA